MNIVKIVLFDTNIQLDYKSILNLSVGQIVLAPFRKSYKLGFILELLNYSNIENLKEIKIAYSFSFIPRIN